MAQLVDGRYELIEVIGSGGMATVWRARDVRLERQVALKRPHPVPQDDPRFDRLRNEARLAASISHPHLVSVHDAGADADGLYLVMELIEAPSLAQVGGQLTPDVVVEVGMQIARALAAVHRAGVVHRDVKPGNILMADGGAKLTDFGIAAIDGPLAGDQPTAPGAFLATANYAAPETLAGHPATDRSDTFALGVVLYEQLAGQAPFAGADRTRRPPTLYGSIGPVLDQCLSPYPEDRPSATHLAAELNGVLADLRAGVNGSAATAVGQAAIGMAATAPTTEAPTVTTAMPYVAATNGGVSPAVSAPTGPPSAPRYVAPTNTYAAPGGGHDPTATQVMGSRPPMAFGDQGRAPGIVEPPKRPPSNAWIGPALVGVIGLAAVVTVLALLTGALNGDTDDGTALPPADESAEPNTSITVPTDDQEQVEDQVEQEQETPVEEGEAEQASEDNAEADDSDSGDNSQADADDDSGFGSGFFDSLREVEDFVDSVTDKANEIDATAKDVRDVMKKVEEATELAQDAKPEEAAKKLEEAAKKLEDRLDGESRDQLLELLDTVADQLDLDDLELVERFGDD